MPNETVNTWSTSGRTPEGRETRTSIQITEESQSFTMPEGEGPYGVPVNASFGVSLIKALWEKVKKEPDGELKKLLQGSFAITLDKNVLLKTLSQPKCEGIRFYPCLKSTAKGDVLSLVTVGVDDAGKDLLYDFKPGTPLETRSLVAEYGHPPTLMSQTGSTPLDPFVLFQYSQ